MYIGLPGTCMVAMGPTCGCFKFNCSQDTSSAKENPANWRVLLGAHNLTSVDPEVITRGITSIIKVWEKYQQYLS